MLLFFPLAYTVTQVECLLTLLRVFHVFLRILHKKPTGIFLCLLPTLFLLQQQVAHQQSLPHLLLASFPICHYLFLQQTLLHRLVSSVMCIFYSWYSITRHYKMSVFVFSYIFLWERSRQREVRGSRELGTESRFPPWLSRNPTTWACTVTSQDLHWQVATIRSQKQRANLDKLIYIYRTQVSCLIG